MIGVHHRCKPYDSYRAERVKSLFNAESHGERFDLEIDADLAARPWGIGAIIGPSGSGKTSIAKELWGQPFNLSSSWPKDAPIIDAIAEGGDFNAVTGSLSAVGLGSVPSWLRPFHLLSNGEQFRAGLARLLLEPPEGVAVVDEFTSVVDRQVAQIGAAAFAKAWRRSNKGSQFVALSPHYDIIDWLQPDWIIDTRLKSFTWRELRRPPAIQAEIRQTAGTLWKYFNPHYYLDLPHPISAHYFVGWVGSEAVAHLAVCPFFQCGYYRATRLVVMPDWQGAGIGMRFLNAVCQWHLEGNGRCGRVAPVLFHTSHPQLAEALRRDSHWVQKSAQLHGGKPSGTASYGGHLRAVQGFAYFGETTDG